MIIAGFKGEIKEDTASRRAASTDTSLFQIMPQAVAFPQDADDVKALVRFASQNAHAGITLTARAGGTDMTGGPLTESFVVDFTRHMHNILEVGHAHALVEPGAYYRNLEKKLSPLGLMMPSYPASKNICAVGGMVANNSGGEKTLSYGKTADYVQELHMVCSDGKEYAFRALNIVELRAKMRLDSFEGNLYREMWRLVAANADVLHEAKPRVSKNSAGYALWDIWNGKKFDLTRLITGSQGTLGLITKIRFRLVRPKTHSRLLIMFLRDTRLVGGLIPHILSFHPESFESYDDNTLWLGMRYMMGRFGLRFLPEAWMIVKNGGFPKLILMAEFTGDSEREALAKARSAAASLRKQAIPWRITSSPADAEKYWAVRRESFNLLRTKIKGKQTAPFIDDIIVPLPHLSVFLPELEALLAPYRKDMTYTVAGHMGNGNFHIIPLMDLSSPRTKEVIMELAPKVYALIARHGGSITAEHNDGLIRTQYLEIMYGKKVCELFAETKRIFDPQNIFNPHKKVLSDATYAMRHMKKA